jgi:hypothetical protein
MNIEQIAEFERVRELAMDISKSMCNAYLLGQKGQAIEFIPRHEHDRDAWVMGNKSVTE